MNSEHAPQDGQGEPDEPTATDVFDDGLVSRLTLIEDQPLESRAVAYAQLHDGLRERLEGGDVPRSTKA